MSITIVLIACQEVHGLWSQVPMLISKGNFTKEKVRHEDILCGVFLGYVLPAVYK